MSLKLLNIVAPWNDKEGWGYLMHLLGCGMLYQEIKGHMETQGYYVPIDLIETIDTAFDKAMSLDIGARQYESGLYEDQLKEAKQ